MINLLVSTALTASIFFSQPRLGANPVAGSAGQLAVQNRILASGTMDFSNRYPVASVSEGFKENILIAVDYLNRSSRLQGDALEAGKGIVLQPGEVFAFHKNIMPEFKEEKIITQESGFVAKEGYKYVAGLAGNGVCHLASLMNRVATEAGLEVTSPTSHDFAKIPGIDKKYGTSIKFVPSGGSVSERQNLYIKNNFNFPIQFVFSREGNSFLFSIITAN